MNRLNTPPLLTDRDYRVNEKGNQSYVWHAGIEIEADRHRNSDESPTYMGRLIASLVHLIGKGKQLRNNYSIRRMIVLALLRLYLIRSLGITGCYTVKSYSKL